MNNTSGQNDFNRQLENVNRMLQAGRVREEKPIFSRGTKTALATIALLGPLTAAVFSCDKNEPDLNVMRLENLLNAMDKELQQTGREISSACADLKGDEPLCKSILKYPDVKEIERDVNAGRITRMEALATKLNDYQWAASFENTRLKSIFYTKLKQCETKEKVQQLKEDAAGETREKIRRFEKNPNRRKDTPVA